MDRGVKIAIFVASIGSLALGLIWDQVLTDAREAVKTEVADEMGPEVKEGKIGPPNLPRLDIVIDDNSDAPPVVIAPVESDTPKETAPKEADWMEYTVQDNDSWWKIANRHFKGRGLSSSDILNANPTVKNLQPGQKIKIPPAKLG
ncbi:LysM domain-containing protein [Planctomycetota bacterium]|nr:LysM domain-containing protein [Planctomycetota bacterium]